MKKILFLILAIICILIAFWQLGLSIGFWIVLVIWIILFILMFIFSFIKIAAVIWVIIAIAIIFSTLSSFKILINFDSLFGIIGGSSQNSTEKTSEGIALATCTSTINDTPKMLDGLKSTIYSAPLLSSSPNPDQANSIRTFSYKGIKDKTEKNDMYVRVEMAVKDTFATGYGTAMEACDSNNKATESYTTAKTDYVIGKDVVASTHYFHGGKYLHGTGDYRIDVYIKDKSGTWHLVDRMTGITIIE